MGHSTVINGTKPCNCPLHNGERLPVNRFRQRRRKGRTAFEYEGRCKAWSSLRKTLTTSRRYKTNLKRSGRIPLTRPVLVVFEEIVWRVGKSQAARELGIARINIYPIIDRKRKYLLAETVARAIEVRDRLRADGIVRHKNDIKYGSSARGKLERAPTKGSDFYKPNGDAEAERGRARRREGRRMLKGYFLCGCKPELIPDERFDIKNAENENDIPLVPRQRDSQGYAVCAVHGKRLYGWASIMVQGPQGNEIIDYHAEYVRDYGLGKNEIIESTLEDKRDNRDPFEVALTFLPEHDRMREQAAIGASNGRSNLNDDFLTHLEDR